MTADLLTRLAGRTLGVEPVARPRGTNIFEPVGDFGFLAAAAEMPVSPPRDEAAPPVAAGPAAAPERREPPSFAPEPKKAPPTPTPARIEAEVPGFPEADARRQPSIPASPQSQPASDRRIGGPADKARSKPRPAASETILPDAPRREPVRATTPPPRLVPARTEQASLERPIAAVPARLTEQPEPAPEIKVTIGRIEVRAAPPPPAKAPRPSRMMSLDDYLDPRRGRA